MRRHDPAGDAEDSAWDEVALRISIAIPAQPHADQASTPPYDAHGGVLPIITDPVGAPAVLGESVDATPCGEDGAVVEFLRVAAPPEPDLADKKNNGEENSVANERAAHDEVRSALTEIIALTEA